MTYIANKTRNQGDPRILSSGPSSLGAPDRLGRALGWFSFGLGLVELLAPHRVTRMLGMEGHEPMVRAFGAREIGAGFLTLSLEKQVGLWSRVAGDGLDLATLTAAAARPGNAKRGNVMVALGAVAAVTILDLLSAQMLNSRHTRRQGSDTDRSVYRNRSGFPQGLAKARGLASRSSNPRMLPGTATPTGEQAAT